MTVTLQLAPAKTTPCEADPEFWFPIGHKAASDLAQIEQAKKICRRCPKLAACQAWVDNLPDGKKYVGQVAAAEYWPAQPEPRQRTSRGGRNVEPIRHGTEGGYRTHLRRTGTACKACTEAGRAAARRRETEKAARQ